MDKSTRILIVGAGPVGMSLACELLQYGFEPTIIDKRSSISDMTRAIGLSHQSMDYFEKIGVSREIMQEAIKVKEINIFWKHKRLANINHKFSAAERDYFIHYPQNKLEHVLEKRLLTLGGNIERNVECLSVIQHDELVSVTTNIDARNYDVVVGCDGGNSVVRASQHFQVEKNTYDYYFKLADIELENFSLDDNAKYYVNDSGYLMLLPLPNNKIRLVKSYPKTELNNSEFSLAEIGKSLHLVTGKRLRVKEIIWQTQTDFGHKITKQAAQGQIFLAGDAIHQFSPVGGMTLNSGINDISVLVKILRSSTSKENLSNAAQFYNLNRHCFSQNMLKLTRTMTLIMCRHKDRDQMIERKFLPKIKNRNFIYKELPVEFSGKDINHEQS